MNDLIVEFLKDAGLNITKSYGDEVVAYCPWHDDSTASLAINVKNGWHCFAGCGKGRTIQNLLERLEPKKNLYQRFLDTFPEFYIASMDFNKSDESDVDEVPYDLNQLPLALDNEYLAKRGITNESVNVFGLRYYQDFNSIVVPIYQNQKLVGSVQRRIVGNPKYINSPGMNKDRILYPFDHVKVDKHGRIILVEGLLDAIKAHQGGISNVVTTFGGSVSQHQARMLGSLTRTVVICPDKDAAGIRMAHRTTEMLHELGLNVEYTFAQGEKNKDFGDMDDFTSLEYHSYWKLKVLKADLNYLLERSNA